MIIVFGATGTLGSALLRAALARDLKVRGAARSGTDYSIDITDDSAVRALIRTERPRVLINCAAITDIDFCEKNRDVAENCNARAPGVMARIADECGAQFVQISTDHLFTRDGDRLHDETRSVSLVNEYARSKYAGEVAVLAVPGTLALRTNVTGWRGWPGRPTFVEWAVKVLLQDDKVVTGFSDFFTSTIDAATLAIAILDLIALKATGRLNVAAREVVDKATFLRKLADELNVPTSRICNGSVRSLATPRAESLGLDVRRAEAILGYHLPDLRTVITALVRSRRNLPCAS